MTRSAKTRPSEPTPSARVGLSLLDVGVVVVVVSGSLGFAAYSVVGFMDSSRLAEARDEVSHIRGLVDAYRAEHGELPQSLDTLRTALPGGSAMGRTDPWNHAYRYQIGPDGGFVLFSLGPDGTDGTDDDIYPFGMEWRQSHLAYELP